MFEDLFSFSMKNKYFMGLLLKGMESEDSVNEAIIETRIKMEEAFQNNIKRAIHMGILPSKDPALQSALLVSLIEGILSRWLFGPAAYDSRLNEKSAKDLAQEVVRFEFFGLLGI
ncbi:hypothetical protein [Bacillus lumedeiriae]|uniref:hypothetical protein n=1 Tax=Bacillus lumedeiriae TaxID=3058829 RepID=UPI003850913B